MGHRRNVCPCVLSRCRQEQRRGRRGVTFLCPVPMLAARLVEWLVVQVHKLILDQSADGERFPTADLESAGAAQLFHKCPHVLFFCDCRRISAQLRSRSPSADLWMSTRHQKHPMTSPRENNAGAPDETDVWTWTAGFIDNCWTGVSTLGRSRKEKRREPIKAHSQPTKHPLLLFRKKSRLANLPQTCAASFALLKAAEDKECRRGDKSCQAAYRVIRPQPWQGRVV